MGQHVIMGRRDLGIYSVACREGTIVVDAANRLSSFDGRRATIAASLGQALTFAEVGNDVKASMSDGAELVSRALPLANRLYFTRVRAEIDGDTAFQNLVEQWQTSISEEPDAKRKELPFAF